MKKTWIALALVFVLLFAFIACSNHTTAPNDTGTISATEAIVPDNGIESESTVDTNEDIVTPGDNNTDAAGDETNDSVPDDKETNDGGGVELPKVDF